MVVRIPASDENLIEISSEDTVETLLAVYDRIRNKLCGKTILDIKEVYLQLIEWTTIERVDLIIPYHNGHKTNDPTGGRIWYLSQSGGMCYNGCFFDLRVSEAKVRCIRKQCRLSAEAIKFMEMI